MTQKPQFFTSEARLPKGIIKKSFLTSAFGELYFIEHPHIPKQASDPKEVARFIAAHSKDGVWVYYPWKKLALQVPTKAAYVRLRTARNRNLITPQEQEVFRGSTVGIAGLSVGSAALATLVATGGPERIKLADPDIVEITNLNRMRATLPDVGESKVSVVARAAYEVDPYLTLECWPKGVAADTLTRFIHEPKLGVFIDEMDNIELKFKAREVCKKHAVPVVMATDNGDSIILDVERFDQEPKRPLFHGRVTLAPKDMKNMTREKFVAIANEIIDPTQFTLRQQASIMEIGKALSGVAQLGTAATLAGVAVAFATRRILVGEDMPSGRYVMSCEQAMTPNYSSKVEQKKRNAHTKVFIDAFKRKP